MDALYYSNFCKHSKELLTIITKSDIKKNIYFICIDKRKQKNGITYVSLENGKEIKLPDIIKSVPSMILFSRGLYHELHLIPQFIQIAAQSFDPKKFNWKY